MDSTSQDLKPGIWVLDDEAGIRAFVGHVAKASGFAAEGFASAITLIESAKKATPEILVLDLSLGQSDAVEVMQQLSGLNFKGKVLLISGRDEETLQEVTRIGTSKGLTMLPPLRKPFRAAALHERLFAEPKKVAEKGAGPVHVTQSTSPSVTLTEALHHNWVQLWYQPKVQLSNLTLAGAEALARVIHPVHGVMPPATFLPPAGDPAYGPLSARVIRLAMADWQLFARQQPLSLAVNIPVSVVGNPEFVPLVRSVRPSDPRFTGFVVEVTEDELVNDPQRVKEIAAQLRLYDVCLSIDDFGSACSSLSRFLDLSFTEVKIDRRFVDGCAKDGLKAALCRTVIDLSHRFGARVCAEGVEEAEDALHLISIGCDLAQGYFFAKPMPSENFALTMLSGDPFARQRELLNPANMRASVA